ncbi:hypothetical protein BAE44_0000425 [Dichanthelium oligosanthes]|uniref:Protein phosphatase n=1 Tax=Dichanthelium oligosanthes TaxID=888268 RepID=A0A1E5WMA8_9POAL|nr:hypothetical protein BAE44_0000425 [Dichanthelium oligosanthes]
MLLGVAAGAFSRGLMESARAEVASAAENGAPPVSPYQLLELAYKKTRLRRAPGRQDHTPAKSERDFFNEAPFQLGADKNTNDVTCSSVGETAARAGDVMVAGTDGLLDKLRDAQLERAVQMGERLGFSPQNMADIIASAWLPSMGGARARCLPWAWL